MHGQRGRARDRTTDKSQIVPAWKEKAGNIKLDHRTIGLRGARGLSIDGKLGEGEVSHHSQPGAPGFPFHLEGMTQKNPCLGLARTCPDPVRLRQGGWPNENH